MFLKVMLTNKKYYLLVGLIIILGFFFRILVANSQPLCLDEKYSIFYATQFNYSDLLKNFSSDVHPGFYYSFLKSLLGITNNKTALRTLSSIIPQILGILFLSWFFFKRNKKKEAFLLSFIFAFNPFFNHLSFQLRSYSLIFLITIVVYLLICLWQEERKKIFLFIIFILLLIGNLTHYVMYIFSFFVLVFISLKIKTKKVNKFLFLFLTTLLMLLQFFLYDGFSSYSQYKNQFQDAGWIATPSFYNIPKVYLTSLGMDIDTMNTLYGNVVLPSIVFYSALLFIFVLLIIKKPKISFLSQKFFVLSIAPLLTILFLSYLITLLSHRVFLNQFIPRISLFIPRIQLPFIIILWISIIENLFSYWKTFQHKLKANTIFIVAGILVFYWGLLNFNLNVKDLCSNSERDSVLQIFQKNQTLSNQFNLWPHWMWIEAIQLNDLKNISALSKQKEQDRKFEQLFIDNSYSLDCSTLQNVEMYSYVGNVVSQQKLQSEVINLLDKCCTKQDEVGLFKSWKCEN